MTMRLAARYVALLAIGAVFMFSVACSIVDGDDDTAGNASGATASSIVFSTDLGPTAARNLIPSTATEIRISVKLEGVRAGQKVTAKWYQLGVADVPSEGKEIQSKDLVLPAAEVTPEGTTFANFAINSSRFPEDAWLVRVFVGDELVRTGAFVVTSAAGARTSSSPAPQATATPQNYTILANDTLTTIAQKFLPQGEQLANFIGRIQALNNLQNVQPTVPLTAGQTLRIPGAQ